MIVVNGRLRLGLAMSFLLMTSSVWAKDTIHWQTYHIPPISIKMGDDKGKGFVDKMLALIIEQLPEYNHEHPFTSHVRALKNMREGKPVCHPGLFKTKEREGFMYFSQPSLITPNLRLVSHKQSDVAKQYADVIKLEDYIANNEKDFGLIKGRSYGKALDLILTQLPKEQLLFFSVQGAEDILRMVSNRRIDLTVAYPFEIGYFNNQEDNETPLNMSVIKGVKPYAIGYVACSKTPWGKQVIDRINTLLPSLRRSDAYIDAMTYWWQEERNNPRFIAVLDEAFPTY
jgi:uncharacterized protein (TIGR02285 family)